MPRHRTEDFTKEIWGTAKVGMIKEGVLNRDRNVSRPGCCSFFLSFLLSSFLSFPPFFLSFLLPLSRRLSLPCLQSLCNGGLNRDDRKESLAYSIRKKSKELILLRADIRCSFSDLRLRTPAVSAVFTRLGRVRTDKAFSPLAYLASGRCYLSSLIPCTSE